MKRHKRLKDRGLRRGLFIHRLAKRVVLPLLLVAIVLVVGQKIKSFLYNSPYFSVAYIDILSDRQFQRPQGRQFCRLTENTNIFKLDLVKLSRKIREDHPEIQEVVIRRHLPNKLIVEVSERRAVGWIELGGRHFLIDNNGLILPEITDEDLPVITGCRVGVNEVEIGRPFRCRGLNEALTFLEALSGSSVPRYLKVARVDVTDYRNLSLFMEGGLEVKMGRGNFAEKLKRLAEVFPQLKADKSQLRYIDLRFKDVIIRPK